MEFDLERFFDRMNNAHLMGLLCRHISDRGLLELIRGYLNNGIVESGIVSPMGDGASKVVRSTRGCPKSLHELKYYPIITLG